MPTLGAPLDFAKLEGRNFRGHLLGTAPAAPVTGQLYFNTGDNTLYWYDGTSWVSARGGVAAVPDASPSVKGIVQLAGDLSGTAASPQIAAGAVGTPEVAAANKDGADVVPSMRSLGNSPGQAMSGMTALNQVPSPIGDVSLNSKKIIGLADPIGATDAANKQYVDAVAQGLDVKGSVRLLSRGNVSIASAPSSIDATPANVGDRILLIAQTAPAENGIYIYNGTGVAMTRASDMDNWLEVPGAFTFIESGGVQNADTGWVCTSDRGGTLGTTAITWTQFSGAGSIGAGAGLTQSGNTLNVGAGQGINAQADWVEVADDGIVNSMIADGAINLSSADVTSQLPVAKGGTGGVDTYNARVNLKAAGYYTNSGTHGAGTTISITTATHGLRGSMGLHVQVQDVATGAVELPDIVVSAGGNVTITYAVSVAANSKLVTIVG